MIAVHQLSRSFASTKVLHDINLEFEGGTLTALLGGNGAGKSTLLKIIGGSLSPTTGEVLIGRDRVRVRSVPSALRAGVRTAHQEGALIPAWSVGEHFRRFDPVEPPWAALAPHIGAGRRVSDLSQTDRQLIEVARALQGCGGAVLLDEPTAGLDPSLRDTIIAALARAAADGAALVWVTHDLVAALAAADRVVVLRGGKIVADAPARAMKVPDLISLFTGKDAAVDCHEKALPMHSLKDREPEVMLGPVPLFAGLVTGIVTRRDAGISERMRDAAGLVGTVWPWQSRAAPPSEVRYMSRERHSEWDFSGQTVFFNLTASVLQAQSRYGFRDMTAEVATAGKLIEQFSVVAPSAEAPIESLSGGNRQKVVLARLASCSPRILLLDEPFSGVDAPTRAALSAKLRTLAATGVVVAIHSQEVPDLVHAADRVIAVHRSGRWTEVDGTSDAEAAVEEWLAAADSASLPA